MSLNSDVLYVYLYFTCPLLGKKTCCHGPGYASPLDAVKNGPRETLLYVTCVRRNVTPGKPDFLATVDVDPQSDTYSQVRQSVTGIQTLWDICPWLKLKKK